MNRTALIPLGIFLLVLIIATVLVAHYEKAFLKYLNTSYTVENVKEVKKKSDVFDIDDVVRTEIASETFSADYKPNLYVSITEAKDLLAEGKNIEAENKLKTLLVFYPKNIEVMSLLSGIYCITGKYNQADDLLRAILKFNPKNYIALENLGFVLERQKEYKDAITSFFKASLINPNSSVSYLHLASIYSKLDDKDEAMINFKKAYRLLGDKIYPFTFSNAFINIRTNPEFVDIMHKAELSYTDSENNELQQKDFFKKMSIIKVLPDNVSNKIAAGEVIERPASVIKELIENSIDAGADRINISIEKAGKKLIAISDDGCGMDPDDAVLSLEPHATSKIYSEKDITKISTMGFRGEALPSIASVSKLKLRTKQKNATVGTELIISGGRFVKENPIGCAPGTEIIVSDLFFNIPARKKFLKTDATEEKHIYETVCLLALANYNISFELKIDGRTVISTPKNNEMLPRICDFLGRSIGDKLIKVQGEQGDVNVTGYVSKPGLVKNSRRDQRIFINKRPIRTLVVYSAISEAYNTMIMKGSYPIAILYIDVPVDKVDINVHPAKHEARFQNPYIIKNVVIESVSRALKNAIRPVGAVKKMNLPLNSLLTNAQVDYSSKIKEKEDTREHSLFNFSIETDIESQSIEVRKNDEIPDTTGNKDKNEKQLIDISKTEIIAKEQNIIANVKVNHEPKVKIDDGKISLPGCEYISFIDIIDNTYILCSSDDGLIVVDQHAAHERILFEKLLDQSDESTLSQKLLLPITIEFSMQEYNFLIKCADIFNTLGFEIEGFGNNTVIVTAIPVKFPMNNISGLISDMIENILNENNPRNVDEHVIARTACKFAVKANDILSKLEAEQLLKDLSKCKLPYSCPHGRPTVINISFKELEKRFGRKL